MKPQRALAGRSEPFQRCEARGESAAVGRPLPPPHTRQLSCRPVRKRKHSVGCFCFLPLAGGVLPTVASGWVLAGSILAAVRLTRKQAEDSKLRRLQDQALYGWKDDERTLLLQKAYDQARRKEASGAANHRIEEARRKAALQQEQLQEENRRIMEAAARKKEQAEKLQAAERQRYQAQEAALQAELEVKAEAERKIRAERLVEQQKALEARRREAELERKKLEAEKRERELERMREEERIRAEKAAERREMQRLAKKFALSLEGTLDLSIPPPGAETEGRLPVPAIAQLDITAGSLVGGNGAAGPFLFGSVAAAEREAASLTAGAAFQAAELFAANARLQNMMGQGPLLHMSEVELRHWMRCASLRTAFAALQPVLNMMGTFSKHRADMSHTFEVRTERGVLPESDPRQTEAVMRRAIAAVEADNLPQAQAILEERIEVEREDLQEGMGNGTALSQCASVLTLAFFLDLMWYERPNKRVEASPWYESASKLAMDMMTQQLRSAPQDTLQDVAKPIAAVVPNDHVILRHLNRLAEANLSNKARARQKEEEDLVKAELAKRLVAMEIPDRSERTALKIKEAEKAVPIPERVWALRNVGETSAMGGGNGVFRARSLLERALQLKESFVGSSRHPGILPELNSLAGVLELREDWEDEATELRLQMLDILSKIAEAYIKAEDMCSGVALLEAVSREYETIIGMRHPTLVALNKRAYSLFQTLSPEDRSQVKSARQQEGLVQRVISAFEEELASRQTKAVPYRYESWDQQGVASLQPLLL